MKLSWISRYSVLIIAIACLLSRTPQLLNENLILDGDECVVGIMAIHSSESNEVPFFFYGQPYGFSFIEVATIRLFYWMFGVSDISIKLAMLFLWSIGIIFFYKTLKQIEPKNNKWTPLLITLVFVFSPSFAIWSMKARGGYLTAFVLSSIVIFLLFNKKWKTKSLVSFIIGLLIIIIYQSQPLWLVGLLPLLGYRIFQNRQASQIIAAVFGIFFGILLFNYYKGSLSTYWNPPFLSWPDFNFETIILIPKKIYFNLTGNYNFGEIKRPIFITKFLAVSMFVSIFTSILIGFYYLFKKKSINPIFYYACTSVILLIGYLPFLYRYEPRYLLPLSGFAFFMIYILIDSFKQKRVVNFILILFISLGAYSLYEFKNVSFEKKPALISLMNELESKNINHVYSEDVLLQWQLMFYSKEQIIGRFKNNIGRYPEYIRLVDLAFNEFDTKTALVGFYNQELVPTSPDLEIISETFFIWTPINKKLLIERGFNLNKIERN
jgi:hypothetical protein